MAVPVGTAAQHILVQVSVVSGILFRVGDSFSPCGHRWAQGQAWVSMSTWPSRVALIPPWETPSTWQPSGEYPAVPTTETGPSESGAAKHAGDSGANHCYCLLLLPAPLSESVWVRVVTWRGGEGREDFCCAGESSMSHWKQDEKISFLAHSSTNPL